VDLLGCKTTKQSLLSSFADSQEQVWRLAGIFRQFQKLDFIHSGRIAKRFGQVLYEPPRNF